MKFKALVIGALGAIGISTAATAADVAPIVIPAPPPVVVPAPTPVFDWSGFYVGASAWMPGLAPGLQAGFNMVRGNLVIGVEGNVIPIGLLAVGAAARVGVALGAEDRILPYVRLKAMYPIGAPFVLLAGDVGVEVGIGRRMSIFAEAGILGAIGTGGGCCGPDLRAGLNFHF